MTPLLVLLATVAAAFAADSGWVIATYLMALPAGVSFYLLIHGEI